MSAVSNIPVANNVSSRSSFSEDDDDSRADPDYTVESESEIENVHRVKKKQSSYHETSQVPDYKESSVNKEQCLSRVDKNAYNLPLDTENRAVTNMNAGVNLTEG